MELVISLGLQNAGAVKLIPAAMMLQKSATIHGVVIPRRRFTVWATLYFALFVALPVLGVAFLLDLALYLLADRLAACLAFLYLFECKRPDRAGPHRNFLKIRFRPWLPASWPPEPRAFRSFRAPPGRRQRLP
jgi:hypothetical protein